MVIEVKEGSVFICLNGVETSTTHNEVVCLKDNVLIGDIVWLDTDKGLAKQLYRDKKGRVQATMAEGFTTVDITGNFKTATKAKYVAEQSVVSSAIESTSDEELMSFDVM